MHDDRLYDLVPDGINAEASAIQVPSDPSSFLLSAAARPPSRHWPPTICQLVETLDGERYWSRTMRVPSMNHTYK
jgi:hypothetical protein